MHDWPMGGVIILVLENVVKNYQMKKGQKVEALKGISFRFPETGMVFIAGKSGSGKSTLLNILGLLDSYDGGEFLIDGKCSKDFSEAELNAFRAINIGFVFQEFHIIEKYTIGQNISLPLEIQKEENNQEKIKDVLKKVGLEGFENRSPARISGGQKQRIAIARAIIKDPKIILADEPTGSLDSVNSGEIFRLLTNLSKEKLIIVISHDIESAHKYADQIIELKDGKIDKIYAGDGGAEAIKFTVDSISADDIKKYNEFLNDGKKVVIIKEKKKTEQKETTLNQRPQITDDKKISLPFNSAFRLSFISLKSKFVRTFLTILVAVFAVAFFGFSDMISRFDANKLTLQELNHDNLGFVTVGAESIEDYGVAKQYDEALFLSGQINAFNSLNLEAYPVRAFVDNIPMHFKNYEHLLPRQSKQYYDYSLKNYTECADVSRLGLKIIAGRAPEEAYEIMITTYHMQGYELFGFKNEEVSIASVTDFEQIQDQYIYGNWMTSFYRLEFKIVGLIEVDVSEYEALANIKNKVTSLSQSEENLLTKFINNSGQYINNIYVTENFTKKYQRDTLHTQLSNPNFTYNGISKNGDLPLMRINEDIFNPGWWSTFKDGYSSFEDVKDTSIIMSVEMLEALIPGAKLQDDMPVQEFCEIYDIFGSTITLTVEYFDSPGNTGKKTFEFEIIGVWVVNKVVFIPENLYSDIYFDSIKSFSVPANNDSSRIDVLNKVNNYGEFAIGNETFRFLCKTPNYFEIRQVNQYFALFVNIFSILAVILCFFAIILTYTFISQSIVLRKKDIGILRSLGARKYDVAKIFIIEGLFIAFFEILFGVLACYAGFRLLHYYFISQLGFIAQQYSIISFSIRQILLISVITVFAVAASIFIPILRIANKQPVDAIRN